MTTTSEQPAKTRVGNFNVGGINHLALVCRDMQQTVDFYEGLLGFPLVKTIELPGQMGQHFFFDIGNGTASRFSTSPTRRNRRRASRPPIRTRSSTPRPSW